MVGHIPLEDGIGVRVPVPQQHTKPQKTRTRAFCTTFLFIRTNFSFNPYGNVVKLNSFVI